MDDVIYWTTDTTN